MYGQHWPLPVNRRSKREIRGIAMRLITTVVAVLMLAGLAACGGGGQNDESDPGPTAPAAVSSAGIWTGTLTPTGQAVANVVAFIAEDGRFTMLANNGLLANGTGSTSGNTITASGTGYMPPTATFLNGTNYSPISISATVVAKSVVSGSYSVGGGSGAFNLNGYQTSWYERSASLATVAGVYQPVTSTSGTSVITNGNAVASITAGGELTFNDVTGCIGIGSFTVPNVTRNYYGWTMTLSACGTVSRNGTYSGLAVMQDIDTTLTYRALSMRGGSSTAGFAFLGYK
jgi:hypothetical protein